MEISGPAIPATVPRPRSAKQNPGSKTSKTHRAPEPAAQLSFRLPSSDENQRRGETLLRVRKAQRGAEPKLSTASFEIKLGERWLVTGPNGAGKTSLLKILAGELEITDGGIERTANLRHGWLRQKSAPFPARA